VMRRKVPGPTWRVMKACGTPTRSRRSRSCGGEVQACRGRGHSPRDPGVHRLVRLRIPGALPDVGRKRDLPPPLDRLLHGHIPFQGDPPRTVLQPLAEVRPQMSFREDHPGSPPDPAGPHQGPPCAFRLPPHQKDLHPPARTFLAALQAGGDHPGVIEHQEISRGQELREVPEDPVREGSGAPVQHQKARRVPGLRGLLGDPILGKLVVEVAQAHPLSAPRPPHPGSSTGGCGRRRRPRGPSPGLPTGRGRPRAPTRFPRRRRSGPRRVT
jgi:hypothetical protein